MGSLPPSSRTRRFSDGAHPAMIFLPTALDPVMAHMCTSPATSAAPTAPSPCSSSSTPGGSTACSAAATAAPQRGTTSDGLRQTQLPAASAGSASSSGSSTGKFHGESTATTPCASRTIRPFETRCASLACCTRSSQSILFAAPSTSSAASARTLPISLTASETSSSLFSARSAQPRLRIAMRSARGVAAQAGCAALARATATATSASVEQGTRAMTSPFAGFVSTRHPPSIKTPCTMVAAIF
mmetsp:Transcript_9556/g.33557  ORF Transcript_9556/g.33557 Transcript_9556/m.33557 type:complete len:243 (+) Transcript_9556:797-1525(+)